MRHTTDHSRRPTEEKIIEQEEKGVEILQPRNQLITELITRYPDSPIRVDQILIDNGFAPHFHPTEPSISTYQVPPLDRIVHSLYLEDPELLRPFITDSFGAFFGDDMEQAVPSLIRGIRESVISPVYLLEFVARLRQASLLSEDPDFNRDMLAQNGYLLFSDPIPSEKIKGCTGQVAQFLRLFRNYLDVEQIGEPIARDGYITRVREIFIDEGLHLKNKLVDRVERILRFHPKVSHGMANSSEDVSHYLKAFAYYVIAGYSQQHSAELIGHNTTALRRYANLVIEILAKYYKVELPNRNSAQGAHTREIAELCIERYKAAQRVARRISRSGVSRARQQFYLSLLDGEPTYSELLRQGFPSNPDDPIRISKLKHALLGSEMRHLHNNFFQRVAAHLFLNSDRAKEHLLKICTDAATQKIPNLREDQQYVKAGLARIISLDEYDMTILMGSIIPNFISGEYKLNILAQEMGSCCHARYTASAFMSSLFALFNKLEWIVEEESLVEILQHESFRREDFIGEIL